ncbi:hypothetical protein [Yersinia ruckeri]|uniref:hypothetical protein n=1 Tax=Yersinia ruckeri TaxID=29486 RepID=UPI000BDF5FD9|nr:hypothetical protein [Yersinia ruckeri]MCK8538229.1 hypothetical protein [Yersinia ruckeri]MCK8569975.1 hypothetical protein [Yersinia ruckeri]MCK8573942.1 hypothetical protein [Yersinia ruckeri]MCK8576723.1 hypothetical protein [Yersinia ruckeri]MCK8580133.1 hypothetical protein [Yersinia ruckeri]
MEHINLIYTLIRNHCLENFPSRTWPDVIVSIDSGLKIGIFGEEFTEWTTRADTSGMDSFGSPINQYCFMDNSNNVDNIKGQPANYYAEYIEAMYKWLCDEGYISFSQPDGYLATEKMLGTNYITILP